MLKHDSSSGHDVLRSGVFELDLGRRELRRRGTLVKIQPQPFRVLARIAEAAGEVVTREDLGRELWPADAPADCEQALNFCIRQIRSALGEEATAPRYLETLPRRGYRWIGGTVERAAAVETDSRPPAERPPDARPEAGGREDASRRRGPLRALVPLVALLILALAAGAFLSRRSPTPGPALPDPRFERVTFRRGSITSARFTGDGQVVFTAGWDGQPPRLYVTSSDFRAARELDAGDALIAGSSSAGEVAFVHEGTLARVSLAGGPPKEILAGVVSADWVGGDEFAVARVVAGRGRLEFPSGKLISEVVGPGRLRVSPDGKHVALVRHPLPEDDRGGVVVFDRAGRTVAASDGWGSVEGLAWRGNEIWFTATRVGADCTVQALSLDGGLRTVLTGTGRLMLHDVDAAGRALVERTRTRSEIFLAREGDASLQELTGLDFSRVAGISGTRVLFYESGQGAGAEYASFIRDADAASPVRVRDGRAVALSPDARWMLSISPRQPDHVDLSPIGAGEPRELRVPGALVYESAGFAGEGRTVFATTRDAQDRRQTWLVDTQTSRVSPLPGGRLLVSSTFSPDGRRFLAACPDGPLTCVYPTAGGEPVAVRGTRPRWLPAGWDDAGRLYFRDRSRLLPEPLWRLEPSTGHAQQLAALMPPDPVGARMISRVAVSRDGRTWAFGVFRRLSDLYVVSGLR